MREMRNLWKLFEYKTNGDWFLNSREIGIEKKKVNKLILKSTEMDVI